MSARSISRRGSVRGRGSPLASPSGGEASPVSESDASPAATSVVSPTSPRPQLSPGVDEHEYGTQAERDKNRKLLRHLHDSHRQLETEHKTFRDEIYSQLQKVADQNTRLQQQNARFEQTVSDLQRELRQLKMESSTMKRELQGTQEREKRAIQDQQRDIDRLKRGTQSVNEITRIEAKSDLASFEITQLRAQLLERGVLAPKREDPPEVIEETPPVGTLELGEDIFTARLLLKMGFMKKSEQARTLQSEDSDKLEDDDDAMSTTTCALSAGAAENVSGIVVPEVDGVRGEVIVKYGWLVVCVATFIIQILVLLVMLVHGLEPSGTTCFDHDPSWVEYLSLHVSKAMAMVVAGVLMGKELMDILNYWMVAELLTPTHMTEATITALLRTGMTIIIVGANVAIFMNVVNPADVWLNMTALGFIATIGEDVLNVAKKGFFGHNMNKAVTGLNFQLTFLADYPSWFARMRNVTIAVSVATIGIFATITFVSPDRRCDEHEAVAVSMANVTAAMANLTA